MHIPDGFISPKLYVPAYAVAIGLLAIAFRRLRRELREETIPLLAVMTALAFVLMLVAVPLPGGTSAHASGVAVLAVLFGPWIAFASCALVLLLQAMLFGAGGITTFPVNALAMGFAGSLVAWSTYRLLRTWRRPVALFLAGWLSVVTAAVLVAVALGVQPLLAHRADGTPLFFPFGLEITLPAIVLPHLVVGVGEGLLTVLIVQLSERVLPRRTP